MTGDVRLPKVICPMCEFDIDHRHLNDYPPVIGCRACFVGLHGYCDPASYWCACLHPDCLPRGN
jgi:hypothetical protein